MRRRISGNNLWSGSLLIAFVALFSGVLLIKISDHDLWWHLSLGRDILAKGSLLLPDSFSYTFFGVDQYNGEWFADLLMFLSYDLFGLGGVYLYKFVLLALVFAGLYKLCMLYSSSVDQRDIALAVLSLIVVLFAIRFRLFIRPYLFSYLCFVCFLLILNRAQLGRFGYWFWLLIPVEILWANTSKGAFLGVLLVGLYGLDRLVLKRLSRADVVMLCCVPLASLLNPEGWRIYELLFGFASGDSALSLTSEQQPLSLMMLWGGGWTYTVCYQVLVVTGCLYLALCKGWRNLFHLSAYVVFLAFSISLIRMIDFFALLSGLFFFLSCRELVTRLSLLRKIRPAVWSASVSVLALACLAIFIPGNQTYAFGTGVKEKTFPQKAVHFLRENNVEGRMFNSYPFGGYLTFFYPEERVFIDGRGYHLYPTDFQTKYLRSLGEANIWNELDQKWQFEVALLEYDYLSFGRHYASHLVGNPDWALVFWDDETAIYLKKTDRMADLISRYQYKVARPAFYEYDYLQQLQNSMGPQNMLQGLNEDVVRAPQNQEIRLARAFYLFGLNPVYFRNEILADLEASLKLEPDMAMEHSAKGYLLYQSGDLEGAMREAREALRLDPSDQGAKFLLEKLGR